MIIFHSIPFFLFIIIIIIIFTVFREFYRPQMFVQLFKPVLFFCVCGFLLSLTAMYTPDLSLHTKVLFCDPKIDILILRKCHLGLERHQG